MNKLPRIPLKTLGYRLGLTLGILLLIFYGFQKRLGSQDNLIEIITWHFSNLRWNYFLIAVAIYHFAQLLGAFRIFLIAKTLEIPIPYPKLLRNLYIGLLFNPLLMGATGGDVVRSYYLTRETGKKTEIVTVVFLDRFVGISVLVGIALVALIVNRHDANFRQLLAPVSFFFLLLVLFAGLTSSRRVKNRLGFIKKLLGTSRLREIAHRTFETLHHSKRQLPMLAKAALITLIYQSLMICSAWVGMLSLGHLDPVAIKYFFLFMPIILTLSAIPISLGGLGVGEALYAFFFQLVGLGEGDAITISLVNRVILIIAALIGGLVYLAASVEPYNPLDSQEPDKAT